jgi:hypothetical protein
MRNSKFTLQTVKLIILVSIAAFSLFMPISNPVWAKDAENLEISKIEPVSWFGEPPYEMIDINYPMSWKDGNVQNYS